MLDEARLAEMMAPVPHFAGLDLPNLISILRAGNLKKYLSSQTLFWEGAPCSGLFVLLEGEVHLYKHGPESQENIMGVVSPITMFNEVAVLDGGENPASARAFTDCLVWQVDKESFQGLIHSFPQVGFALLPILAKRNRQLVAQFEDMCFLPVRGRTAKLLLELSGSGEEEIDRGKYSIQELAARISTSPEVVSRTLSLLTASGYIQANRQTLSVINFTGLMDLAFPGQNSAVSN